MKNGGRRPGAGRPKGSKGKRTLEKEVLRGIFREVVAPEFEAMTRAQIAQAKGLSYLVTRDKRTGKFIRVGPAMAGAAHEETIEVWEKDPSTHAYTDLTNRLIDKPVEPTQELQMSADAELLKHLDLLDAGRVANAKGKG